MQSMRSSKWPTGAGVLVEEVTAVDVAAVLHPSRLTSMSVS